MASNQLIPEIWIVTAVVITVASIWLMYTLRAGKAVARSVPVASAISDKTDTSKPTSLPTPAADSTSATTSEPALALVAKPDRRKTTFRVRDIPENCEEIEDVVKLLVGLLELSSDHGLLVHSFAVDAVKVRPIRMATISFERLPAKLSSSQNSRWELPLDHCPQQVVLVDTNFLGLTTLAAPPLIKHKLDIIAVPGLGGHAFRSFKEKNGDHMWLRDSLPTQMESARVLTWGHDSHLYQSDSFQDLEALGRSLIGDLRRIRERLIPKIFIGHSLGGLIIKQAIILMHKQYDNLPLLEATRGLLCFGVPNQGLDTTSLLPMVQEQPNELFLRSLGPESQLLREQSEQFNKAVSRRDLQLFGFYETRVSPTAQWDERSDRWQMTGPARILVNSNSARHGLESEERLSVGPINRSHLEMVKFARGDDQLDRVLGQLQIWAQSVSQFPTRAFTDTERDCLQSLSFREMGSRRNDVARATDTTCEWIFGHEKFIAWRRGDTDLLWIKGKPGSGKSTLFKHLLDKLSQEYDGQSHTLNLSYLFHGRGTELERTKLGLMRSLCHQLFSHMPDAFRDLTSLYQSRNTTIGKVEEKWKWHDEELYEKFHKALTIAIKTSSVQLMIDALDEGGEDLARQLVKDFESLTSKFNTSKFRFSVLFTCRHYPILSLSYGSDIDIQDQSRNDIEVFVDKNFPDFKEQAVQIRDKICVRADGVFQWADLVCKKTQKALDRGESMISILQNIAAVPSDLDQLYRELINSLEPRDCDQAFRLFRWLCYGIRPLTLAELRLALVLQSETPPASFEECHSRKEYVDSDARMRVRLTHLSCGLAEVREVGYYEPRSTQVQFIHQSVQEFFKECTVFQVQGQSMTLDMTEPYSHCLLAWACANCVALKDFQDDAAASNYRLLKKISFSEYAVKNFIDHVRQAQATGSKSPSSNISNSLHKLGLKWLEYINIWLLMHNSNENPWRKAENSGLLHFAIRYGLLSLLSDMSFEGLEEFLDKRDSDGQTPLSLAARIGLDKVVRPLLDTNKVDVNSRDKHGWSPLSWAAWNEHSHMVKLLLAIDTVDVNSRDNNGQTPLSLAAGNGHSQVVKLLLTTDTVDVDSRDNHGQTPLSLAAGNGHSQVVKLLLAIDTVDVNSTDSDSENPLFSAIKNRRDEIVKLLLATDIVDVNSRDNDGWSPLSWAAWNGHSQVVKMLLKKDTVDVNSRDDDGKTPLSLAAGNRHSQVVTLLLAMDTVDVNSRDIDGRSPLSLAARDGDGQMVKLLLETNTVDMNSRDYSGQTPLSLAAENGHSQVVKLLLAIDTVDVNSRDNNGQTPLSLAAWDGNSQMVELLLATDTVDVNSRDNNGQTPLSIAARHGDSQMVELLLATDTVNVNSRDNNGQTPLSIAARHGDSQMVELLLATETVDVNSRDKHSWSPLSWAAWNGHSQVVKLLLATDTVDVNSRDNNCWSPLSLAAGNGHSQVVELLLATDTVDVDSRDDLYGQSPLLWAAEFGHCEAIRALLASRYVDANAVNYCGVNATQLAYFNHHEDAERLLREKTGAVDDFFGIQFLFSS